MPRVSRKGLLKRSNSHKGQKSHEYCSTQSSLTFIKSKQCQIQNPEQCSLSLYKLTSNFLVGTQITSLMLAVTYQIKQKLKNWLIQVASRQFFFRQTYALCSYYIDLYFQNGSQVQNFELQNLGICCFTLAAKYCQDRSPKISYENFNRNELLTLEKHICIKLNFLMNPQTYVSIGNWLLSMWQKFQVKQPIKVFYFNSDKSCYLRYKNFFQRLDCMSLVMKTNDFELTQLVFNVFFIENRINSMEITVPQSQKQFLNIFYKKDNYHKLCLAFLKFCDCDASIFPEKKIGKYIKNFYHLQQDQTNNPQHHCQTFIQLLSLLTHNKGSLLLARSVIEKYKSN